MASFGHLAVGLLAGRLHDGGRTPRSRPVSRQATIAGFALLGMLPDTDVVGRSFGVDDWSFAGHRGASHSLLTALAVAITGGLIARRYGWGGLRTALAITLAIGSHGLLDMLSDGGRPIPLFWPLSDARFIAPWAWLPDAPRGMRFLSRDGLYSASVEFLYFLPATAFALWPRPHSHPPVLEVLPGGGVVVQERAPEQTQELSGSEPANASADREREPASLRSLG